MTNLAARIGRVASDLRMHSEHASCGLASAPPVEEAYGGLNGRWNFNRDRLANSLDGLAEAILTTRQAFVDADSEMAHDLDC